MPDNNPNESDFGTRPRIDVLAGPTASGKTLLALRWAEQAGGVEIVSADASLFYRGMDIGTAKPDPSERARVPHHLIDVCDVDQSYDIARYLEAAVATVAGILARGNRVLVVGGSGFYLKCFFGPVIDGLEIPAEVRARVRGLEAQGGVRALVAALRAVEPDPPPELDLLNPRRVARALERRLASGVPLAELAARFAAQPHPFSGHDVRLHRLDPPRADLAVRIDARVRSMLARGLVEEVRALRELGIERNPPAATAIGYRETLACLRGELPESELAHAIGRETRRLVRKQTTWLRHQLPEGRLVDLNSPHPW